MTTKVPQRRCVGCMVSKDKPQVLRVVKNKEGEILFDIKGKLEGRGAYVCKSTECLEKAIKTNALKRALKSEIPQEIITLLREEISRKDFIEANDDNLLKIWGLLGLCAKAGKLSYGDSGVYEAVTKGKAELVILAQDCGKNTSEKFQILCKEKNTKIITLSQKKDIGKAVGKDEKAVISVNDTGFAKSLLEKL
ncbi:MAG: DUF448 domain-containing protein [Clostridia bacterium]|nr:DUF448 domain-containing protein [Clostridia bacterium]